MFREGILKFCWIILVGFRFVGLGMDRFDDC